MQISLLVIRCSDIEASNLFYEILGMSFLKEKHKNGPTHYSCECDGLVFELYPGKDNRSQDDSRLGFKVPHLTTIKKQLAVAESYELAGTSICVVTDPDGRKVEISE